MKNKRRNTIMFFILLILGVTIGFAILTQTLKIDGTGLVKGNSWDIHWANPEVIDGSVTDDLPILSNNDTLATYEIDLYNPGDFYEFTIDAVNEGTIDAEILSIENKFYASDETTELTEIPAYIKYSIKNSDGTDLVKGQRLDAGDSNTYRVRVDFRDDIDPSLLPEEDDVVIGKVTIEYVQANVKVDTESFKDDDWGTISDCAKLGNCPYQVGDTKEIDLGSFGKHTLRIANMSTPSECSQKGFSQTACGFVLEFTDIISTRYMNDSNTCDDTNPVPGTCSYGGWSASPTRTYVNTTIYNALPTKLKDIIKDTYVVSGRTTSNGYYNIDPYDYVTTDKLFLLSSKEVYGTSIKGHYDEESIYDKTRQLDYYEQQEVTLSSYSAAIKRYTGEVTEGNQAQYSPYENAPYSWWLRSASSSDLWGFQDVYSTGNIDKCNFHGSYANGISPAFRLG